MKQTTLGKGKYEARNYDNRPDSWERKALAKFETPGWKINQEITEVIGLTFRYIRPIYIKSACLVCHGEPKGELGPYGNPKEGYKIGDIRGGISVMMSLEKEIIITK